VIRASARGVVPAAPGDVYALLLDPARPAALSGHRVEVLAVESESTVVERRVVVDGEIRVHPARAIAADLDRLRAALS
jgi:hypothetical protein